MHRVPPSHGYLAYGTTITMFPAEGRRMFQYIHLDRVDMADGKVVKAGQPIGGIGRVEGKARRIGAVLHLHFEVVEGSRHIYPMPLIR